MNDPIASYSNFVANSKDRKNFVSFSYLDQLFQSLGAVELVVIFNQAGLVDNISLFYTSLGLPSLISDVKGQVALSYAAR
ncbi:MAG: hypothetical protein ACN4E2_03165 [Nitrospinota bacterium]